MTDTIAAIVADRPADYARFRLNPTKIAVWEDGARTDNRPGTYEWWSDDAIWELMYFGRARVPAAS